MKKFITYFSPITFLLAFVFMPFSMIQAQAPNIDVWYGDTQEFGNNGEPQSWCNIQGNITDNGTISTFTYSLNGGSAINLSIGPDNRRLVNSGDFNIDIDVANLLPGSNSVLISATDNELETSTKTVTINYTDGNIWPIPYSVDWSSLNNDITQINDVAHVVDGKFQLTPNGIRTTEPGYDRLIAIGDMTSTNYEVLVPVTIHSMQNDGGVGVLLRWKGHTDTPVSCAQPKCGYEPLGAISWFRANKLEFYQGNNVSFTPVIDVTYMFRTSVETETATGNTNYRIKFWEQGTPEPVAWNLERTEGVSNEQEGSFMLIAHKSDVTFGNVTTTPGSLSISNIQTQLSNNNTEATVTWNTNQPTTSHVDYGPTTAYEDGFEEDANLVTSHSINLTGLTPDTIYQYKISGENSGMEAVERTNLILSTYTSGIHSDDFCGTTLNPVWTFDDPVGDCSYTLTGSGTNDAFLEISVPGGSEHQIYTSGIKAPNMMQSMNNSDFEVEVKFESGVIGPQYQQQGILVKESNNRYLRFEFYSRDNNQTYLYAQAFNLPAAQTATVNSQITTVPGTVPLYMRVKRIGNDWTLSYSFDGANFTVGTTFIDDMVPTQIGPYAGNAVNSSSPAHIGKIDYFLNLADPIIVEDDCIAQQPPVLAAIGNQTVEEGSNLSLTLTATDADGNDFDINYTETGLPSFASLTDNNDGTATLDIDPLLGDEGIYPVTITVTDSDGLTDDETFDIIVSIPGTGVSSIVSDDFCDNVLNPIWSFNDPLGGGSYTLAGSGTNDALLEIAVPGGSSHELWTNGIQAPHIIQTSNDTDFELEVKMESTVSAPKFQEQGIMIRQDDYHFLRFEFYSNTSGTFIIAASLESDTNTFPLDDDIHVNANIVALGTAPMYMRVKREGNLWTQSYSFDGTTWTELASFPYAMVVSGVGLYSGNASGASAPAHTAQFDYFKNLEDPILNEDGCNLCLGGLIAATWNGSVSSDWDNPNNWTPNGVPTACSEITIPVTANTPTITDVTTITNLNINSGSNVLVPLGTTLNITGDLTMYSASNTFSGLVVKGSIAVEGTAKYHRYTNAQLNRNDLISPPLIGQTWNSFLTNDNNYNADVLYNDGVVIPNTTYLFGPFEKGATDDYVVYAYNDDETLFPSKGYRVATNTPVDEGNGESLIFTGSITTGTVYRDIENDFSGNYSEWNLVGNPYPAYIDVDTFLNHVGSISGETNLSLLDETTAAIYGYNADTSGGIWTITNLIDGPDLIAPGQGFFVSSNNLSATLEFTPDMQVVGSSDDFVQGRSSNDTDFIKLKATTATNSSIISVYFHDNGSTGLDIGYDAAVFGGTVPDFSLYSHLVQDNEGIPMVIQTLNTDDIDDVVIPLNLNANQGQQIAFNLEDYNLPPSVEVYLEDNLNNTFTLLNTSNYTFTPNATISGVGRFFLRFTTNTLSIEETSFNTMNIYSNQRDRSIVIEGILLRETEASVYDLLGRMVLQQELDSAVSKNILNTNALSSGVYIVTLQDDNQQLTKKVIIK